MKRSLIIIGLLLFFVSTSICQTTDDEKYEQASKYYEAKEYNKAIPILKELADKNHAKALNLLGVCYNFGYGVNKNISKSIELYQKSANLGWKGGQLNLAYSYLYGDGIDKDYAHAFNWFKKAAEAGSFKAFNELGVMYQYGEHVEKDLEKAHYHYQKAAEQGYYIAQINLAWLYQDENFLVLHQYDDGDVRITENKFNSKTEKWLREAAKQNVEGLYELAQFYSYRVCVHQEKDRYPFVGLAYKKAAEAGSANAMAVVGAMLLLDKKYTEAKTMLQQSKDKGIEEMSMTCIDSKSIILLITLCDYFQMHKEYELLTNSGGGVFGSICCWEDVNSIYLYAKNRNGKTGFLKLSQSGKVLASTPFIYDYYGFADYKAELGAFQIDFDRFIDITGKEVKVEL